MLRPRVCMKKVSDESVKKSRPVKKIEQVKIGARSNLLLQTSIGSGKRSGVKTFTDTRSRLKTTIRLCTTAGRSPYDDIGRL